MFYKTILTTILLTLSQYNAEGQTLDSLILNNENVRLEILSQKCYSGVENIVRLYATDGVSGVPEITSLNPKNEYEDKESHESTYKRIDAENYAFLFKAIGIHELAVKLNGNIDTLEIMVNPLPFTIELGNHDLSKKVELGPGEFKAQPGLRARVKGFDMQAYLTVVSFQVIRIRRGKASEEIENYGGEFSGAVTDLIRSAFPKDVFIFSNVLVRGPGFNTPTMAKGGQVTIKHSRG